MRLHTRLIGFLLVPLFLASWPAEASYDPTEGGKKAGQRMMELGVITGRPGTTPDETLSLRDDITRAEIVTIFMRAIAVQRDPALLNGTSSYRDVASHWASGYVAAAEQFLEKAGGPPLGYPDGTFAPDQPATCAEAVAFLMKFLGIRPDDTKPWPANYLDRAVEEGLITAEDGALLSSNATAPAARGLAFHLLDNAFYNYSPQPGKTIYTMYVDTTPPALSVDSVPSATTNDAVVLTGRAEDAVSLLLDRGTGPAEVPLNPDGTWSVTVPLAEGENLLVLRAIDVAGNTDERILTIRREPPAPVLAALAISPDQLTGFVGEGPFEFTAEGLDQYGNRYELDPTEVVWSDWDEHEPGQKTITATAHGLTATAILALHTRPTLSVVDQAGTLGDSVSLQFGGADRDGDRLIYSASGLPPGLSLDPASGRISGQLRSTGRFAVTVTVADEDQATASASFTWEVSSRYTAPARRPASFTVEISPMVEAGSVNPLLVTVWDQDGKPMSHSWKAEVTGGIGTVDGKRSTFTASTSTGKGTITVTVGKLEPRVLPVEVVPGPLASLQLDPARLEPFVGDGPLDPWHLFTVTGQDRYGNPVPIDSSEVVWSEVDEEEFDDQTVTATLGSAAGTATLRLHTRPSLTVGPLSGVVGEAITFQLSASDADGDDLTYSASGLPDGLTIDPDTGEITGTLELAGAFDVTVTGEDEDGATATDYFVWTVVPAD